jgi:DNA-binding CsgD family transcriptional regulator
MALALKDTETAVLERLANGMKRKEIAEDLDVSLSSVNNRIYAAQDRVGCRTTEHLLAWFVREAVVKQFHSAAEESVDS